MNAIGFDLADVGRPPTGWICGSTGVKDGSALADGSVQVPFKPVAGREDQAGGIVWRWKDGGHYHVARANALEGNVSLYYTEGGVRKMLKYVDAPVASGARHTLRVEFSGTRIAVELDGTRFIEHEDTHVRGAGAVGVWTKADGETLFRDFAFEAR